MVSRDSYSAADAGGSAVAATDGGTGTDGSNAAPGTPDSGGVVWRWVAWALAWAGALAGLWFLYTAAGGRERALWGVFQHLTGSWTIGSGSVVAGLKVVAATLVTIAGGGLMLLALGVRRVTFTEALGLAIVLGMVTFGYLGQALALAHLLDPVWCWVGAAALASVGVWKVRSDWKREGWRLGDWPWLAALLRRPAAESARPPHLPPANPSAKSAAAPPLDRILPRILGAMTGLLLVIGAWHALLYPVTYWDAMILYVGYARMIFLEGGIGGTAERIVGQIGIGLGANYPHLFAFHHITMAKMMGGSWSSLFAQSISPLCALASALLIFSMLRRLRFSAFVSAAAVLLLNTMPYYISYVSYASNYLLAIALTAVFLWGAAVFLAERDWMSLRVCFVAALAAVHVNYLMWALWLGGALLVFVALPLANWFASRDTGAAPTGGDDADDALLTVGRLATSGRFWTIFAVALLLASPWYVRNVIKTGNPVYAFYYNVFPSKNVTPEVMESSAEEWVRNGDGIGNHALQYSTQVRGTGEYSFADKLRMTGAMFVWGGQAYKLSPFLLGFVLPGLGLWLVGLVAWRRRAQSSSPPDDFGAHTWLRDAFGVLAYGLFGFFLFYHYAVADFYLYQILPFVVPMAFFGAVSLAAMVGAVRGVALRLVLMPLLVAIWLVPGVAFALMGSKLFFGQTQLVALKMPLLDPELFYGLLYGEGQVRVWRYMNENLRGEDVLTHENRHLAFDPSIHFVHLDDMETQALYDLPTAEEKFDALVAMGLRWYLYVPNEDKHPILRRLELHRWIGTPQLVPVAAAEPRNPRNVTLYRIVPRDAAPAETTD